MKFLNKSNDTVYLPMLGIPRVAPGETVEIDDELCMPGKKDNGSRRETAVESYAPQLVLTEDNDPDKVAFFWSNGSVKDKAVGHADLRQDPRVSPGVAELRKQARTRKKAEEADEGND